MQIRSLDIHMRFYWLLTHISTDVVGLIQKDLIMYWDPSEICKKIAQREIWLIYFNLVKHNSMQFHLNLKLFKGIIQINDMHLLQVFTKHYMLCYKLTDFLDYHHSCVFHKYLIKTLQIFVNKLRWHLNKMTEWSSFNILIL